MKTLNERIVLFEEQYKAAFTCFDEQKFDEFFSKIRIAIERIAKLIIADICSPEDVDAIGKGIAIKFSNGNIYDPCYNKPQEKQEGGSFIIHASKIIYYRFSGELDKRFINNAQNVVMQLYTYYSISSTFHHDSENEEDKYATTIQAAACLFTIASLFDFLKDVLQYKTFFSLPQSDFLNKENDKTFAIEAIQGFDELNAYTNNFGDDYKYILLSPNELAKDHDLDMSNHVLEPLFRIHWSMIIDYNLGDEKGLYNHVPSYYENSIAIIKNSSSQTVEGSSMTNWIFAEGQKTDPASLITTSIQKRKQLKFISEAITTMLSKGSLIDIVIVSLYMPSKTVKDLLRRLYEDRPGIEKRVKIVFVGTPAVDVAEFDDFKDEFELSDAAILGIDAPLDVFSNNISGIKDARTHLNKKAFSFRTNRGLESYEKYIKSYQQSGLDILASDYNDVTGMNLGSFYSGEKITWKELENNYDVRREKYDTIMESIKGMLKKSQVTECTIFARPGSGATTIVRKIGFEVFNRTMQGLDRACIVVFLRKYDRFATCSKIEQLSEQTNNTKILLVAESEVVTQKQLNIIVEKLQQGEKNVTILYVSTKPNLQTATFDKKSNKVNFTLDEFIKGKEKEWFVDKYSKLASMPADLIETLKDKSNLEVLDFPMTLNSKGYVSGNIITYVKNWLSELPLNVQTFCAYISFCSMYAGGLYINERLFKTVWTDNPFSLPLKQKLDSTQRMALSKLLIQNTDADGRVIPFWRPRYYPFAKFIMECVWNNWHDRVHEIAKNVISIVSKNGQLEEEDMSMLYSLFVERRDSDFRDDPYRPLLKNFSDLIESINIVDRAESVLETLKNTFPEDPYFAAHYARFLFEKARSNKSILANDYAYTQALDNIENALSLNPSSDEMYHIKGMYYRRRIDSLFNSFKSNSSEFNNEKCSDLLIKWVDDARTAFDQSIELSMFSAYGYVAKGQLYRQAIENYKEYNKLPDNSFLEEDEFFTEMREDFGLIIESLNSICAQYGPTNNPDRPSYLMRTLNMFEELRLYYSTLVGCDSETVERYRKKLNSANVQNVSLYRELFCDALLYSKLGGKKHMSQAYRQLTPNERTELGRILDDRRNAGDVYAFEKIFNLKMYSETSFPIDDAIDLFRNWESACMSKNIGGYHLLRAKYLLACAYAIKAIHKGEPDSESVGISNNYFAETREISNGMGRTPYGNRLTALYFLGVGTDMHSLMERHQEIEKRTYVNGTIVEIAKANKGWVRLGSGQLVSFNSEGFDKDLSIGKTISGQLGFRFQGLGLYQMHEEDVKTHHEIRQELEDEENERIQSSIPNIPGLSPFGNSVKEEILNKNLTPRLTEKGKIELGETKKIFKKRLVEGKVFNGIVVSEKRKQKISCEEYPYPLEIRGDVCELYKDDEVFFTAGKEPNQNDSTRVFWFAKDVHLKDED